MNVSVGPRWEKFIEDAVQDGRYGSATDVVQAGLKLVEEREAKQAALKATIQASIAGGGSYTDEEIGEFLEAEFEKLEKEGY